jgi:hypothetical protein
MLFAYSKQLVGFDQYLMLHNRTQPLAEVDRRKLVAYAAWFIISLVTLVILRNIARHEFPEYSAVIMGVVWGQT